MRSFTSNLTNNSRPCFICSTHTHWAINIHPDDHVFYLCNAHLEEVSDYYQIHRDLPPDLLAPHSPLEPYRQSED